MTTNRQIVISSIPEGQLEDSHFRLTESAVPEIADGQILITTRLLSIDAANRAWMQGSTYRSVLSDGLVMAGLAISEVIASRASGFAPGDIVFADSGWQDYAAIDAAVAQLVEPVEPMSHLLSLYGTSALTAYFGLTDVASLQAGETLVVSAAGGSVGTVAGQIGKILGARVIGIAGGAEKCNWLVDHLGFDAVIDYKAGPVSAGLKQHAPGGIDVYFDNVAGDTLDRCLFSMNTGGRIACCGAVASYDGPKPTHGPRGVPGLLITKRLTMRGFIVTDYESQYGAALSQLQNWAARGLLRPVEDIIEGLENAPRALIGQLAGQNIGKRMVRVST